MNKELFKLAVGSVLALLVLVGCVTAAKSTVPAGTNWIDRMDRPSMSRGLRW